MWTRKTPNMDTFYAVNDLSIISELPYQWKSQFNPETNEQANKVFSRKPNTDDYIPIKLNDSPV